MAICSVCGNTIRFFKIRIKDGYMCGVCQDKLPLNVYSKKDTYTAEELREIIRLGEERDNAKPDLLQTAMDRIGHGKEEQSSFDEVREYKRLLDEGIITEEEYERKRKELLKL